MANTNQKQLRKAIKKWYHKGKKEGKTQPGFGKRTNVGDPRKGS